MHPKLALLVIAALLAPPLLASAAEQSSPAAEALAKEGVELRRVGKDAEALPKFEQAFAKSSNPKHRAQLGLCQQAVGRWVEAEESLSGALQSSTHPWIKQNRDILKQSLETAKEHIGSLEITGSPVGAKVLLDGQILGRLPLAQPLRLNQGSVALEIAADGHQTQRRDLTVEGGQYRKLRFDLAAETLPSPSALTAAEPQPAADSALLASSSEMPAEGASRSTPWLWIGAGAVVVVALGVLALVLTSEEKNPSVDGMGSL